MTLKDKDFTELIRILNEINRLTTEIDDINKAAIELFERLCEEEN